jgi:prepilin-type N-terminal cleavage/methylation domain-containing protein
MTSFKRRGLTLLELLMVVGLFSVVSLLIFGSLNEGFRKWRIVDSRYDTQRRLTKAWTWLKRDLEKASPGRIGIKRVAAPGNGDVIWFLSAEDSEETTADTRFKRVPGNGGPEWQRNILYYLVRPGNYARIANMPAPGVDPDPNNDYYAPHKFLIRKVVDLPGDETLLTPAQVDGYTTTPADYNLAPLAAEANVRSCKLISDQLLSFEAELLSRTLQIDLRAMHVSQARTRISIGATSLKDSPFTQHEQLRILLRN